MPEPRRGRLEALVQPGHEQPHHDGRLSDHLHGDRQHEVLEHRPGDRPVAFEHRVQQREVGDRGRLGEPRVDAAQRRRSPVQFGVEDEDQGQPDAELRDCAGRPCVAAGDPGRDAGRAHHCDVGGGDGADRHRGHGQQRELEGGGQPGGEFGRHRPAAGDRTAQVQVNEVAVVVPELGGERSVQPQGVLGAGVKRRGELGAEDGEHRVARDCADQDKDDQGEQGQLDRQHQNPGDPPAVLSEGGDQPARPAILLGGEQAGIGGGGAHAALRWAAIRPRVYS